MISIENEQELLNTPKCFGTDEYYISAPICKRCKVFNRCGEFKIKTIRNGIRRKHK